MAERVTDLRDIERRVVAHLVGEPAPGVPTPSEPSILVAEDLAPSDTSGLDPELVTALVTERGGATSHTAIIARQLGIPCVVGAAGIMELDAGTFVVVDGEAGTIEQGADPDEARARVEESTRLREELAAWTGPAATADGLPVKLLANVADGPSAKSGRRRARAGRGPVPHRAVLPRPQGGADRRGAGRHLRRRPLALLRRPLRRGAHPRRRLRQADRLRDPRGRGEPRARRARPAPELRQPRPDGPPARRHRRSGRAHRHRDLGDGADGGDRGRGRRLRRRRCAPAGSSPA